MPVFHLNELPKQKRIQMIGEFYDMVDSLKDRDEVRFFFKSLLAADEIAALMRRIEIAVLLSAKFSYREIKNILGAGNNKITAVHKALQQDDNGYKIIVKRLVEKRKKRLKKIKNTEKEARKNSDVRKYASARVLPDLLDAVIEKFEDDKELEKEALLFTPSAQSFKTKK